MGIWLVRHGETALNATRVLQFPETPLSERGIEQAQRLARRLTAAPVDEILTSDHTRARMTADVIERALRVPVQIEPLLQERSFGALRGTAYADLEEDVFAPDYAPPGGERISEFQARVARAWLRVTERASRLDGDLVAVSHGLVCACVLDRHVDLTDGGPSQGLANTAVTYVEGPPWAARLVGCTAHLDRIPEKAPV
jgi:broad specificity phosphatase PhoE